MLEHGYELIDDFISEEDIKKILDEVDQIQCSKGLGGIRNIEKK